MQIIPIPCLTDNYAYIVNDKNSGLNEININLEDEIIAKTIIK